MQQFDQDIYSLTYDEFQAAVDAVQMGTSASEIHGYQSGLVCLLTRFDEQLWLEVLQSDYPSGQIQDHDAEDLKRLYVCALSIMQNLEKSDFSFQLMLPDDDDSLVARVEALGDWCAGFFAGIQRALILATEEVVETIRSNATINELLKDLEAIRQAEAFELSSPEDFIETERNYAEICEYVRVAVMNIFLEVCADGLSTETTQNPNNNEDKHLH